MNKTKIEWCDYTWSPITGCLHGCSYCYARKIATRFAGTRQFPNGFTPTWHPERLNEPLAVKKPARIFVCSMSDPFGDWVEPEWLDKMLEVMAAAKQHQFMLLTKRPENVYSKLYEHQPRRLDPDTYVPNVWLGCTLTGSKDDHAPTSGLEYCLPEVGWHTFVSIEPLLGPIDPSRYSWAEWIIVGAQSDPTVRPEREWVESIVKAAEGRPVFIKGSMAKYGYTPTEKAK